MRVILLGAGGMLGHDLSRVKPPYVTLIPFSRAELDLTDSSLVAKAVNDLRPHLILNAAAYTNVDKAEEEPDEAFRVNRDAVGALGWIARNHNVRVVHFGTDYIFDGQSDKPYCEDSPPKPLNVYGASKLAGEQALQESAARCLIIRTQWLFGLHGRSFPKTMWQRAHESATSRVVSDQTGRPTYSLDLARVTWKLAALEVEGVLHVTNGGTATWYDIADRVYRNAGVPALVTQCTSEEFVRPARRPARAILNTERMEHILGTSLPTWTDAIDRFLVELHGQ